MKGELDIKELTGELQLLQYTVKSAVIRDRVFYFYILGHIQLDYTLLAFSFLGPYLASYSSFPDFVLSVW